MMMQLYTSQVSLVTLVNRYSRVHTRVLACARARHAAGSWLSAGTRVRWLWYSRVLTLVLTCAHSSTHVCSLEYSRVLALEIGMLLEADWRQVLDGLLERLQHLLEFTLLRVDEVELAIEALLVELHALHFAVQRGNLKHTDRRKLPVNDQVHSHQT